MPNQSGDRQPVRHFPVGNRFLKPWTPGEAGSDVSSTLGWNLIGIPALRGIPHRDWLGIRQAPSQPIELSAFPEPWEQDKTAAQQGQCGRFRYRSTIEGEYGIESRRGSAADNVRADPQPVGVERLVANPALQIGGGRWERRSRRNDRSGCR